MKYLASVSYRCPSCNKKIKTENYLLHLLFICFTAFIALSWYISIWIIRELFRFEYLPKLGNPYFTCPNCGCRISDDSHKYWPKFTEDEKIIWAFRNQIKFSYFIGGFIPLLLFFQFAWDSNLQSDKTFALVSLLLAILIIVIILIIYLKWRKAKKIGIINISEFSYDEIKNSIKESKILKKDYIETISFKIIESGKVLEGNKSKIIKTNRPISTNKNNANLKEQLKELSEMLDEGLITQEEYNKKKGKILDI